MSIFGTSTREEYSKVLGFTSTNVKQGSDHSANGTWQKSMIQLTAPSMGKAWPSAAASPFQANILPVAWHLIWLFNWKWVQILAIASYWPITVSSDPLPNPLATPSELGPRQDAPFFWQHALHPATTWPSASLSNPIWQSLLSEPNKYSGRSRSWKTHPSWFNFPS